MFIDIDGIRTNCIVEGEGENVLLLHGWGANIKLFDSIIKNLSTHYKVFAVDLPGFGETSEPKEAFGVDGFVDFVLKFCEKMGIKDTILLGHSNGGRIIIKLLARDNCPLNVTKIILTDSAGIKPKKTLKAKLKTRCYKLGKGFFTLKPIHAMFPKALENLRNKSGSADYKVASPIMRQCLVKIVNEDLTELLPKIKAETLLIWGENDDATPLSDGKLMEKLIENSGLVVLENCGHFAFLEQNFRFLRIIDSFLDIKY